MCFSATVSFGASAALIGLGVMTEKVTTTVPQKVFGSTPYMFGAQQFIEGCLWLALQNPDSSISVFWNPVLTYSFLVFAWIIWPFFIPLFTYLLEPDGIRKRLLKSMTFLGAIIAGVLIYFMVISDMTSDISGLHIVYTRTNDLPALILIRTLYISLLLVPFFISSSKKLKHLGVINLCALAISQYLYAEALISVWCFFAAISSIYIYYIIIKWQEQKAGKISASSF